MDNRPLSEQYRLLGRQWVALESAAHMLEETKSAVFSQKQVALGDMPNSRSATLVRASQSWHDHVVKICEARRAANLCKVELEALRMKAWEYNNASANQRAEMRL